MIRRTLMFGSVIGAAVSATLTITSYFTVLTLCRSVTDRSWVVLSAFDGLGRLMLIDSTAVPIAVEKMPDSPHLIIARAGAFLREWHEQREKPYVGLTFNDRGFWTQTITMGTRSQVGSFGWRRRSTIFPIVVPLPQPPLPIVMAAWVRAPLWLPILCFLCAPIVSIARTLRLSRRRRRNECLKCGYNLTGNVSGECPECGRSIAGDAGGFA